MIVAVVAVLVTAAPAFAHDELLSSTPTVDQRLASAPSEVTLTFSADVLDVGAAVVVADASGTDWVAEAPTLRGGSVTVTLKPDMPAAGYEVRWRVVSSDGHPIAGLIPFTVGDGTPLVRTAAPDASASSGAAPADQVAQENQSTQENEDALRLVLIGIAGAAVAVFVFLLFHFLRRRSSRTGGTDDVAPPSSDRS
jgi:copper resistance protein C